MRTPRRAGAVVGEGRIGEAVQLSASDVLLQLAVPLSRVELGKRGKAAHFAFGAFGLGHDQISRWFSDRVPNDCTVTEK